MGHDLWVLGSLSSFGEFAVLGCAALLRAFWVLGPWLLALGLLLAFSGVGFCPLSHLGLAAFVVPFCRFPSFLFPLSGVGFCSFSQIRDLIQLLRNHLRRYP